MQNLRVLRIENGARDSGLQQYPWHLGANTYQQCALGYRARAASGPVADEATACSRRLYTPVNARSRCHQPDNAAAELVGDGCRDLRGGLGASEALHLAAGL